MYTYLLYAPYVNAVLRNNKTIVVGCFETHLNIVFRLIEINEIIKRLSKNKYFYVNTVF